MDSKNLVQQRPTDNDIHDRSDCTFDIYSDLKKTINFFLIKKESIMTFYQ